MSESEKGNWNAKTNKRYKGEEKHKKASANKARERDFLSYDGDD